MDPDGYCRYDRTDIEKREEQFLARCATHSRDERKHRRHPEDPHRYRTELQRDRDRILHSQAFRRLKHKRQVFLTHFGDHYRTRLTHTLEVAQLSRTIARALGLNEDLVEAIALGHDLGHTPFGHVGEVVLHGIMSGEDDLEQTLDLGDLGGYKHNYQSLRVVDCLERRYDWAGLNLTAAVREGILKHTRLRREAIRYPDFIAEGLHLELDDAVTLEGQVVALCDEIAQRTHDLEDGIRAHYVDLQQVRELKIVALLNEQSLLPDPQDDLFRNRLIIGLIDLLVTDVIEESERRIVSFMNRTKRMRYFDEPCIGFSPVIDVLQSDLDLFIDRHVIRSAARDRSDDQAEEVIRLLFTTYLNHPLLLPNYHLESQLERHGWKGSGDVDPRVVTELKQSIRFVRSICDYIAGMTDNFAEQEYRSILQAGMTETDSNPV
jgi:dGTPase